MKLSCRLFGHAWQGSDPKFPAAALDIQDQVGSIPGWMVVYQSRTCHRCGLVEAK